MKLPNGFGSVYKLSGNRRNPWCARKTKGWTFDQEKGKSYPVYQFIGYYPTRKEALTALSDYNKDPWDLHHDTITFAEVFEKWSEEHFPAIGQNNISAYKRVYRLCEQLHTMKIQDIKLDHLQAVVDGSGLNAPSVKKIKTLYSQMWDYCMKHEIITKDKREIVSFVDISKAGNPRKLKRKTFSAEEIRKLWELKNDEKIQIILFLIYTGVRIGEFYNIKKEDVHLEDRWIQITRSKTDAGIREIPIAQKIIWIIQNRLKTDSDYLFSNTFGRKHTDSTFRESWWNRMMQDLHMEHLPHDTRHTCVSMLTSAGVDERIIRQIVGHKGLGVTETVYTHVNLQSKIEAIDRI